jgi:hypothetical protein
MEECLLEMQNRKPIKGKVMINDIYSSGKSIVCVIGFIYDRVNVNKLKV